MRKIILILLNILCLQATLAEDFAIKIESPELPKIAAFEFNILFDPKGSFTIGDSIDVVDKNNNKIPVLFKFADADNSLIRVFLADGFNGSELSVLGQFKRVNYRGEVSLAVATSINIIADFGQEIDTSTIKSRIEVNKDDDILPYMGISKASILGPTERIFASNLFVSIGAIETYGFKLGRRIVKAKINGQDAEIYDNVIIGSNLKLNPETTSQELEIILELEVDNQTISKKVGTIKLI